MFLIALLLIIYDAFTTKTGFRMPLPSFGKLPKFEPKPKIKKRKKRKAEPKLTQEVEPEPEPDPQPADESVQRRSRFMEAKRMRRK